MKNKRLTFLADEETHKKLKVLAANTNTTMTELIFKALSHTYQDFFNQEEIKKEESAPI